MELELKKYILDRGAYREGKNILSGQRFQTLVGDMSLLLGTSILCFFVIEMGYRLLDPNPYFSLDETNATEHGNLSAYDPELGWKGVPDGTAEFVTPNNKVLLTHNRQGFRDIEHIDSDSQKPAIVFLGDSFTWGYEVEFSEMFVNRLRDRLSSYTIFNLAHRGYGTDQELLTFTRWHDHRQLKYVILMFSENDVMDNNASARYYKPKPQYQLIDNQLVLTGVPVPQVEEWVAPRSERSVSGSRLSMFKQTLLQSHFFHDVYFRLDGLLVSNKGKGIYEGGGGADLAVTSRILEELKKEVEKRGAKLIISFVPSKREIERLDDYIPYQRAIAGLCQNLGIEHFDLSSNLKTTWYRTYYRRGMHWNARGHLVAADAIYEYLTKLLVRDS